MELRDDSILLRPWRHDDAPAVVAACQDAELLHWIPTIPRPYNEDDARAFINGTGRGSHAFAIVEDGRVVGSIDLRVNSHKTASIGYWCASDARGRGIMTRALRRLCRYAVDELHVGRLQLSADLDNRASQRVAEKVGFRREGILRSDVLHPDGRRRDSVLFSLLPGELG